MTVPAEPGDTGNEEPPQGTPQPMTVAPGGNADVKNNKKKLLIGVSAVIIAAACCGIGWSAIFGGSDSENETASKPSASPATSKALTVSPPSPSAAADEGVIRNVDTGTLKITMQKRYPFLKCSPVTAPGGLVNECSGTDPDTGAELTARIRGNEDFDLVYFKCAIMGDQALAPDLLGFCASLPYTDATPAKAQAWVLKMLPVVKTGRPQSMTVASVKLEVAGTSQYKMLTIASATS